MSTKFIPGLQLNRLFYQDAVRPLLATHFSNLTYSAALMGYGSDVLGFDTPRSTDHNWGPRLQLFLAPADYSQHKDTLHACLRQNLPSTFLEYPVNFSQPNLDNGGTRWMVETSSGPVNHLIEIVTISGFFTKYLGIAPSEMQVLDWLTISEQALLEVTGGQVFHDGLAELIPLRARLSYYPHDIWLYRLAAQWARIGQEEAFMGRCASSGDELGSRLVAARLVRDLMRLGFLLEKQYAPYSKWLGTAFAQLACGPRLTAIFNRVLQADSWPAREEYLCQAYIILAQIHNYLAVTAAVEPTITTYFDRPYQVLFADRFANAAQKTITDPAVKAISANIGAVDQFADCVDLTDQPEMCRKLKILYEKE